MSRTPRGVRGLKLPYLRRAHDGRGRRTPRGVRGLKSFDNVLIEVGSCVAPLAGCVD